MPGVPRICAEPRDEHPPLAKIFGREIILRTRRPSVGRRPAEKALAARAFTGWAVENGQRLDGATELPRTGKFIYIEGWHDGYQKRVLATEFEPFAAPMADGRKVLDLVAFHPATAHFLSLKLCRRFVSDNPPQSLVDSAAKVWMETTKKPDQIALVIKHIGLSKEFAASRGMKPKSPLALAVSFARVTGIDLTPTQPLFHQLGLCGPHKIP